jgi:ribose/xylose/arabinose/galactoside ABC-type transport system permease subunit
VQILLAAAVLFVVFSVLYPDSFFSTGTFLNMARVAGILLVVSLGQSFAIIIGGFDTFPLARIWALSASSSHSSW